MAHYCWIVDPTKDTWDPSHLNRPAGTLHSWGPDDLDPSNPNQVAPADVLAARGLAYAQGLPALGTDVGNGQVWAWDIAAARPTAVAAPIKPILISKSAWVMRFTKSEYAAVRWIGANLADAQVAQWYEAFGHAADPVDLSSPLFQQGVPYLSTLVRPIGCPGANGTTTVITSDRVAALLATP